MDPRLFTSGMTLSGEFGDLRVDEIDVEAVFFCFDRCLWFDPCQEIRRGRALDDYAVGGNRQCQI